MRCPMIAGMLTLICWLAGWAQTPEQRGREIARAAERRARGYGDLSASVRMVIRDARGAERRRELTVAALEMDDTEERVMVRFHLPRDLRGTALLTVNRHGGSSDQWLYLPALRRTKRIAGAKRTASFMGSEFSYEDIGTMEVDRYHYRLTASDTLDGMPVWVVERRPNDSSSRYRRQLVWYDRQEFRILRIDFFDRWDAPLKTLRMRDFQLYGERYWRPTVMEMTNHQTEASTVLQWSDYRFRAGLPRRDFEPNRLGHGR